MKKLLVTILTSAVTVTSLTACSSKTNSNNVAIENSSNQESNNTDSSTSGNKIMISAEPESSTNEETKNSDNTEASYEINSDGTEFVYEVYTDAVSSDHEQYEDVVEATIEYEGSDQFNFTAVDWFEYTETDTYIMASILSQLAYTINEYYEGNVPCTYSFDSSVDTVDQYTNMIANFKVESQDSNYSDLLIGIDDYNYKIDVEPMN